MALFILGPYLSDGQKEDSTSCVFQGKHCHQHRMCETILYFFRCSESHIATSSNHSYWMNGKVCVKLL